MVSILIVWRVRSSDRVAYNALALTSAQSNTLAADLGLVTLG